MNLKRYRVAMLVIAAAVAMLLSGCGGDDNGGLSAEDMARIDNAEMAAAAAMTAQAAAEAAQAEAEAEATAAMAAEMAAKADAAAARAEAATAKAAAAEAMAEATEAKEDLQEAIDARQDAEAAQAMAEAAQKDAEDARDAAEMAQEAAEAKAAEYKMMVEELEAEMDAGPDTAGTLEGVEGRAAAARIMYSKGAAPTRNDTLDTADSPGTPTVATDDTRYDGTDAAGAVITAGTVGALSYRALIAATDPLSMLDNRTEPTMVIPRSVSVTDLMQARLGQPAELSLAVKGGTGLGTAMDSATEDAPAIAGWDGVALEKDGPGAITQMALVYSDAERSVRAFGDVYPNNVGLNAAGTAVDAAVVVPTHRAILTVNIATAAAVPLASLDPGISLMHGLSHTAGLNSRDISNTANAGLTVRGSYNGVAGDFACLGANCNLQLTSGGALIFNSAGGAVTLVFQADNPESLLPDSDYLAFGVWTEVPDSPTLANPGRVQGFVHGSANVFMWRHVAALDGTASYSGAAVGHYATRAQGAYMVEMGRFTADAALTANFGADADRFAAGNDGAGLSVSGTIDGFMAEDGTAMAGWVVNLLDGGMLTRTFSDGTNNVVRARASTDGDIYGATSGTTGSLAWGGVWDGWLFGGNTGTYPTGVAGRFQASRGMPQPMTTDDGAIDLFGDTGFAGVTGSFAGR